MSVTIFESNNNGKSYSFLKSISYELYLTICYWTLGSSMNPTNNLDALANEFLS